MKFIDEDYIADTLGEFVAAFPEDRSRLKDMLDFTGQFKGRELTNRNNFTGHFTASCIISDPQMRKFLLLYHKGLGKWLQPGGHIEQDDISFLEAAMREAEEETGLSPEDYDIMSTPEGLYIVDGDSHYIPCRPAKGESGHYHHDVRFLFKMKDTVHVIITDPNESGGYKWLSPDEFPEYFSFDRILSRLHMFCHTYDAEDKKTDHNFKNEEGVVFP